MWTDNETDKDFLNFEGIADTVAQIIQQANGRPVSIGISGAWGVGKSSMIRLTKTSLDKLQPTGDPAKYVYVEFNAWLYQGYDDARAALLDVIASTLMKEAEARASGLDKAKDFLKRVEWFRLAKVAVPAAVSLALGIPPVGALGQVAGLVGESMAGSLDGHDVQSATDLAADAVHTGKGLLKAKEQWSPPKEIQALRDSFEELLSEMDVTLVVLIDDLDRCLPETTISTLEAIRLFLFLERTAFVIAADDQMIKYAVKKHFEGLEDDQLVTNYFDKLIQIPIRVPSLGTQEVRAYMMMLFVDNSDLSDEQKESVRDGVASQLKGAWQGKRVDREFISTLVDEMPAELSAQLDTAERLAPLMTRSTGIAGNPRLVKRFLNALAIRLSLARAQGVSVDEAALAKLLLFERIAGQSLYAELMTEVNADPNGHPEYLESLESAAIAGEEAPPDSPWRDGLLVEWLKLPPQLAGLDMRGALYVSREQTPLITDADRLSSEAAKLLALLVESPDMAESLSPSLAVLPRSDIGVLMDQMLILAGRERQWGTPDILTACVVIAEADPSQGSRLAGFLLARPPAQIEPSIVPRIADYDWSEEVLRQWKDSAAISDPVKREIVRRSRGNVAK